jgi:hypothetical protein
MVSNLGIVIDCKIVAGTCFSINSSPNIFLSINFMRGSRVNVHVIYELFLLGCMGTFSKLRM